MIEKILPLTNLKLSILSELYQKDLNLLNLEIKTGSLKQSVFKTLKSLKPILNKENNIYSIKKEYLNILKPILINKLLISRLKDKYILLSLIKKYYNPSKMFLFGSCAKGEMTKDSDIDIFVISNICENENIVNIRKFSKSLNFQIQIISVKKSIIDKKINKYSNLYDKIKNNIKEGIEVDLSTIE